MNKEINFLFTRFVEHLTFNKSYWLFTKSIHSRCGKCAKTFSIPNTKMELYEMCQISKIIQHGYSTVANLQRYRQMLQKFYCFIFPCLSSLSSFFLFSSLSLFGSLSFLPMLVPYLFDQSAFHFGLSFPGNCQCRFGAPFEDKIRPQIELALPVVNQKHLHNRPIIVDCIGREASGENPRRWQRRRRCSINHACSHPRSISPISPRGCRRSHPLPSPLCPPFHSASLWLWVFFFFFGLI